LKKLFGGNGRQPGEPAATQDHVPIAAVDSGLIISKPLGSGGRVISAVLRVGSIDILRMSEGERADFLEKYASFLATWRFPYQILVWRERQNVDEFLARVRDQQAAWSHSGRQLWAGQVGELAGWIQRVATHVNPQVPAYFIALPHPVMQLGGEKHAKAIRELDRRCHTIVQNLGTLQLSCRRMTDAELLDMIAGFYHPTVPMLRIPPKVRLQSLMVGADEFYGEEQRWSS
jgi:hypothetical protein